jgi:hypothetical protein
MSLTEVTNWQENSWKNPFQIRDKLKKKNKKNINKKKKKGGKISKHAH